MTHLLDTDTCSAHMRRPAGLAHRFFQYAGGIAISSVAQFARQSSVDSLLASKAPAPVTIDTVRDAARDLARHAGSLATSALGTRDQWQVIDQVATLELGGAINSARHRTMADIAGSILEYLAARPDAADNAEGVAKNWLLNSVEHWLAVAGTADMSTCSPLWPSYW